MAKNKKNAATITIDQKVNIPAAINLAEIIKNKTNLARGVDQFQDAPSAGKRKLEEDVSKEELKKRIGALARSFNTVTKKQVEASEKTLANFLDALSTLQANQFLAKNIEAIKPYLIRACIEEVSQNFNLKQQQDDVVTLVPPSPTHPLKPYDWLSDYLERQEQEDRELEEELKDSGRGPTVALDINLDDDVNAIEGLTIPRTPVITKNVTYKETPVVESTPLPNETNVLTAQQARVAKKAIAASKSLRLLNEEEGLGSDEIAEAIAINQKNRRRTKKVIESLIKPRKLAKIRTNIRSAVKRVETKAIPQQRHTSMRVKTALGRKPI